MFSVSGYHPSGSAERKADMAAARPAITIRYARDRDEPAVVRLAALDSSPLPRGSVLLAEVGGELWAACSLETGSIIADPFRSTGAVQRLLAVRAAQLRDTRRVRRPSRRTLGGLLPHPGAMSAASRS
jgi:hypothetical protein